MNKLKFTAVFAALTMSSLSLAADKKPVVFTSVVQAESELMFGNAIERAGGVNKFDHSREPATYQTQKIVRTQGDMLYSHGVFDASQNLTVSVPDKMTGYQSAHLFDANHAQLGVVYPGESKTIKPADITTESKHIYILVRTSTDKGLALANKAQDLVSVVANSNTPYTGPGFDLEQLTFAKKFLASAVPAGLVKAKTAYSDNVIPGTTLLKDASAIEKYHYITSSLLGWGLMPNDQAYYPQLAIKDGDCVAVNFEKPPVMYDKGGYWSFTAYGNDGYLRTPNPVISAYKAKSNEDGSYTVNVGNSEACKSKVNNLDMPDGGASITLRLYKPVSLDQAKAFEAKLNGDNQGK